MVGKATDSAIKSAMKSQPQEPRGYIPIKPHNTFVCYPVNLGHAAHYSPGVWGDY